MIISEDAEYKAIRDELGQSKRYVFERPLVIAALSIASLKLLGPPIVFVLPCLVSLIYLFNFWFTVNRLLSGARIAAYIQLVLEEEKVPWLGWESSLRRYRVWLNQTSSPKSIIADEIDQDGHPDALMFYPAIFYLHAITVFVTLAASVAMSYTSENPISIGSTVVTIIATTVFFSYAHKWRPSRMRGLIERNRVIWEKCLEKDT